MQQHTNTSPLDQTEINRFRNEGYLFLKNAISPGMLSGLKWQFEQWLAQSREFNISFGEQSDGRSRISLESSHNAMQPAIRRIASPKELSDIYLEVMRDNVALDAVAQLIGPNIKFNNAKINSKHPGSKTNIDYHQDFMFEPHSNDDLITVLIFLDDLTEQNGPLNVVPGSHKGPLYGHWHDQVFTGTVSSAIVSKAESDALPCYGPAGSACLMHTRLLHGSGPNYSKQSRTLYMVTYSAEDAYPLQRNTIPSVNAGDIVRGKLTNRVRCSSYEMDFPEMPTGPSFFEQQAKSTRK